MIDIHCHILHGIDDGAKDMKESIEMARLAYRDGIRHIIATPHFNASFYNHRDLVLEKVRILQNKLDQLKIDVKIYPGNEVRLESASYIYEHGKKGQFCYLGPTERFVLLEQTWSAYAKETLSVIQWFLNRGTIPIIPHPERHTFFRDNPQLLTDLIAAGAWTQVSVDSLLGKNTADAEKFAFRLIQGDHVHTLATDAHNVRRKPNLAEGFHIIERTIGKHRVAEIKQRTAEIIAT